jgi:hypothetical protein
MYAVKFDYNGKTRYGVVEKQYVSKGKKICVLVKLTSGEHKTFHADKITNVQYLN